MSLDLSFHLVPESVFYIHNPDLSPDLSLMTMSPDLSLSLSFVGGAAAALLHGPPNEILIDWKLVLFMKM